LTMTYHYACYSIYVAATPVQNIFAREEMAVQITK